MVLIVARIICVSCVMVMTWISAAALVAPGQRVHNLVRLELPTGDLVLVALPEDAGRRGTIALWWAGEGRDYVEKLVSVAVR